MICPQISAKLCQRQLLSQHFKQQGSARKPWVKSCTKATETSKMPASWTIPHWTPQAATYALPESTAVKREGKNGARGCATENASAEDAFYADGQIAREAVKRLQAAGEKPQEPFFLAVGFVRPHLPFVAPQKYWDLYQPASLPMPKITEPPVGAPAYAGQFGGELRQYSDMPETGEIDADATRRLSMVIMPLPVTWMPSFTSYLMRWTALVWLTTPSLSSGATTVGIWEITASGANTPTTSRLPISHSLLPPRRCQRCQNFSPCRNGRSLPDSG